MKPNCGNCPDHTENQYMDFCHGYPMSNDNPTEMLNHIKKHGCLDHPGAREYLMQDVVKELNRREHNLGMHLTEREKGKCDGYNEAIALIRDGVK